VEIREGENAMGDLITMTTLAAIDEDEDSVKKVKDKVKKQLHNTVATKQYKILGQKDE
jgi:predicted amino acid-binding ACT domain protein